MIGGVETPFFMNITLYKTKSANNAISKKLVSEKNLGNSCMLADNTSVTSPTVIIGGIKSLDTISDYNYAYIAQCHRYYYINDIIALSGGRVKLILSVDVLMSFKSDILNSTQLVIRQKNKGKMYLADADWTLDGRTYLRSHYFNENHFAQQNDSFVLITV